VVPDGDALAESTWSTPDAGIVVIDDSTRDGDVVTVWVKFTGAVVGETYSVINHITTAAGREDDQTIRLKIKQF
jgi:hypothetical protein